jgi:hypothetical protein
MTAIHVRIQPRQRFRWLNPIHTHFRAKRMRQFAERFPLTDATTILDVGGTPENWRLVARRPQVTLLNLPGRQPARLLPNMRAVAGDARQLPYADQSFDIVYSNSVIEHVGPWEQQQRFAREVQRVGCSYYVQTPNKWFPIEPHILGVGIHWLPRGWQQRLIRYVTLVGLVRRMTPDQIDGFLTQVRLLTYGEVRVLFPDAEIQRERFLGLTKSFVITRPPVS